MKTPLREEMLKRRLVCDGAMGTQLMLAGLEPGACGELWNLAHADRVMEIHRRYVDAGADCLITNTFGATRIGLARHGQANDVRRVNAAASRIAREAFGDRAGYVLGDIGPLGVMLEPYGDFPAADARAAFEEQARALVESGVDAIIIETQTSIEELGLAIDAAKAAGAPCIIGSLAYDRSAATALFRTMMGVSPEQAAAFVEARGADVVALNCGTGMDMPGAAEVVRLYRRHCKLPAMAQPNAGLPTMVEGRPVYQQTPADMVRALPEVLAAGANIVGSCCGSSPQHTRAIRQVIDDHNRAG